MDTVGPIAKSRTDTITTGFSDRDFVEKAMAERLLPKEEEQELARAWRDERDERALHRLTQSHMRLVIAIAARFRRYGLPMSDLIQEGNIGLMKAAERFEPERDIRFSTYSSWWIRSCIQDYVLRNWSIVRTGTTSAQKSLFFNLRRLRATLGEFGNGSLTPELREKIANTLNVREADVDTMSARLAASDRSLNAPVTEDAEMDWQDLLADEDALSGDSRMEDRDAHRRTAWLGEAIDLLSDREQMIIRERRLTDDSVTLESLGQRLGISKERVRQIEQSAMGKLKRILTERFGDPDEAGLIPSA